MEIDRVPGLEPDLARRLRKRGIRTARQLVLATRRNGGLQRLCLATEIAPEALARAVARAELSQLRGVGPKTLDRLMAAGIHSLPALAAQEPAHLRQMLRQDVAQAPNLAIIRQWIEEARQSAAEPFVGDLGPPREAEQRG